MIAVMAIPPCSATVLALAPLPAGDVRLGAGAPFAGRFALVQRYLLSLQNENLLQNFLLEGIQVAFAAA